MRVRSDATQELDQFLILLQFSPVDDLLELGGRSHRGLTCDHDFLFTLRVVHPHNEHEAIELSFGKRVGALLLNGVLGWPEQKRVFAERGFFQLR